MTHPIIRSIARAAMIVGGALVLAGPVAINAAPRQFQARPAPSLTFAALEQRALAMGIRPTELKIKYEKAEIEGRDASGRKVEVRLDPRTGSELSRKFDD